MVKLNSKIIELKPHTSQPTKSHSTSVGWGETPVQQKVEEFGQHKLQMSMASTSSR
jgi:hypothetical protein